MMRMMDFNCKWVSWIKSCLETISISIFVNGNPMEEFKLSKGLRQGDHIALFLFFIVAEGSNSFMRQALLKGMFFGYKVGNQ